MEALGPVLLGQRLFSRGQYLEAEAMYCQALENFPPKSAGRVLIRNKLGILYEKMGDSRRALDSYEKGGHDLQRWPYGSRPAHCWFVRLHRMWLGHRQVLPKSPGPGSLSLSLRPGNLLLSVRTTLHRERGF